MAVLMRDGAYAIGNNQNITSSISSSTVTSAMLTATSIVRVATNTDIWIAIGTAPQAFAANSAIIPGGGVEFFAVNGGTDKVAVLAISTAGNVSISELASAPF